GDAATRVGDRMAVRILRRVAHEAVDRAEHAVADVMLEHFRVLVDLRPIELQHSHEERLEDSMPADEVDRELSTLRREPRARPRLQHREPNSLRRALTVHATPFKGRWHDVPERLRLGNSNQLAP